MRAKKTSGPGDLTVLSAAFTLVFRQGRSPPSCPAPDDAGLINRIRDAVPAAPDDVCRDALIRVRRLSFDAQEAGALFCQGAYGEGDPAKAAALADLEAKDPGFSSDQYRTAFAVGCLWAGLS